MGGELDVDCACQTLMFTYARSYQPIDGHPPDAAGSSILAFSASHLSKQR
jgi:hypothetical protein